MNFNKTSLGVGVGVGGGELPEWSKVNYLESDEVGVDQKKKQRGRKRKQAQTKYTQIKIREKHTSLKKK